MVYCLHCLKFYSLKTRGADGRWEVALIAEGPFSPLDRGMGGTICPFCQPK